MRHEFLGRTRLSITVAGLTLAIMVAAAGAAIQPAGAQDVTPTPGVLTTPAANLDCTTVAGVASIYAVASAESEAR